MLTIFAALTMYTRAPLPPTGGEMGPFVNVGCIRRRTKNIAINWLNINDRMLDDRPGPFYVMHMM